MKLVGVDGCRAGWVVATSDVVETSSPTLTPPTFSIVPSCQSLLARLQGERALIAVDIPIGLPSGAPRDNARRRADAEARAFLGPRRSSSVFSAPSRPTLDAKTHREACEIEVRARGSGEGLSQQTYRIIPKIQDVDRVILPEHQEPLRAGPGVWVREVHPEVTFAVLKGDGAPGHGLVHSKRGCKACRGLTCPGEADRLALLRAYLPTFEPRAVHEQLLREYRRRPGLSGPVVGRDDIVDAVVCLVTASRIVTGTALTLPAEGPERDVRGLRMEIVA